MNALVLGGNGFIGSHLVDRLLAEGHSVRVFDKYSEHYRFPLPDVDYRTGDFGNRGALAEALEGTDTVFHLICTTLPKTSNDDPAFDITSNVVETLFLLEQCISCCVKKVVFISSGGTVYGTPTTLPICEENHTEPLCSYGITKVTIEKYLALFHALHGLDYIVLRPSNPYGPRQNPLSIQGAIPVFLGKVAKKEVIEIWGDGEVTRDYLYIEDLVDAIYRAAITQTKHRIFNVGSGEGASLNDILFIIRNVTRQEIEVSYLQKRAFDVERIYLDISRARSELSWTPMVNLTTGIARTWSFVKEAVAPGGIR